MGAVKHVICECEEKDHAKGKIRESCKFHERRMFIGIYSMAAVIITILIMSLFVWVTLDIEMWVRQRFATYYIVPLIIICAILITNSCFWMNYDNYCNVQKAHYSPNTKGVSCKYCNDIPASNIDKTFLAFIGLYYIIKLFKKKSSKSQ